MTIDISRCSTCPGFDLMRRVCTHAACMHDNFTTTVAVSDDVEKYNTEYEYIPNEHAECFTSYNNDVHNQLNDYLKNHPDKKVKNFSFHVKEAKNNNNFFCLFVLFEDI